MRINAITCKAGATEQGANEEAGWGTWEVASNTAGTAFIVKATNTRHGVDGIAK